MLHDTLDLLRPLDRFSEQLLLGGGDPSGLSPLIAQITESQGASGSAEIPRGDVPNAANGLAG